MALLFLLILLEAEGKTHISLLVFSQTWAPFGIYKVLPLPSRKQELHPSYMLETVIFFFFKNEQKKTENKIEIKMYNIHLIYII